MSMNDITADMLTRVRNANRNRARRVQVLNSKLNKGISDVLKSEGYITDFSVVEDSSQGAIDIELRYGKRSEKVINSIDRVSKPGCRVYSSVSDLPRPMQGLGIAIVSTSQGVMSDRKCREENIGGEVVAIVT